MCVSERVSVCVSDVEWHEQKRKEGGTCETEKAHLTFHKYDFIRILKMCAFVFRRID